MKSRNCEILIHNCEINLRNIFSYVKPCFCKLMALTLNLISGLMSCLQLNNLHKPIINHIRSTVTETAMSHVYCKQLFIFFFLHLSFLLYFFKYSFFHVLHSEHWNSFRQHSTSWWSVMLNFLESHNALQHVSIQTHNIMDTEHPWWTTYCSLLFVFFGE